MNQLRERLKKEFADPEYREVYAESFLNSSLATQLQVIREQRGMTQAQLAEKIGTKQAGISRIENVNYSAWNSATLRKIAFALGCRLKVSLETFGSLIDEAVAFNEKMLQRPSFEEDPVFRSPSAEEGQPEKPVDTPIPSHPEPDTATDVLEKLEAGYATILHSAFAAVGDAFVKAYAASLETWAHELLNQSGRSMLQKENRLRTPGANMDSRAFYSSPWPLKLWKPCPVHKAPSLWEGGQVGVKNIDRRIAGIIVAYSGGPNYGGA
jgi:transcriptional regulator with XRE-family HTH domain